MTRLQPFEAERYVIAASYRETGFRLMDLCRRRDGALEITFPYLHHAETLVSICTLPANRPRKVDVSLVPGGKVVTGTIKYNHAMNGRMGFFQPDREAPVLEKMGPPLLETTGHVF